jgi:hypothetical protein
VPEGGDQHLAGREKGKQDDQGDQQETRPPHQPQATAPGKQEPQRHNDKPETPQNGASGQLYENDHR